MATIDKQIEDTNQIMKYLQQKKELVDRINELNGKIQHLSKRLGVSNAVQLVETPKKTRVSNSATIQQYIYRAMAPGAHMKIDEIAQKVLEKGYKTKSKTFNGQVGEAVRQRGDTRRISYGKYVRHNENNVGTDGQRRSVTSQTKFFSSLRNES